MYCRQYIFFFLQNLGYSGDIGYQTFLYSSETDVRRIFVFLIEKLPKESEKSILEPTGKAVWVSRISLWCQWSIHSSGIWCHVNCWCPRRNLGCFNCWRWDHYATSKWRTSHISDEWISQAWHKFICCFGLFDFQCDVYINVMRYCL